MLKFQAEITDLLIIDRKLLKFRQGKKGTEGGVVERMRYIGGSRFCLEVERQPQRWM